MPQFNPPDWLIKDYLDRKSPVEQASEGVANTINSYAAMKNMETQRQNDALGTYVKAFEAGGPQFAGDVARRVGLQNPPALPGRTATMTGSGTAGTLIPPGPPTMQPAPEQMPTPTEEQMQQSLPGEHVIGHWNETMGQQTPAGPNLPGSPDIESLLTMGNFGRKEIAARESLQKLNDSQTSYKEKYSPKNAFTPQQILDKGTFDPLNDKEITVPDQDARESRKAERLSKAVTDYGKQIETNPIIKKLHEQNQGLHSVEEMLTLVGSGNTVASSAMGMKMARAMGEVGVITENDVKRYVESRALGQAAADKLSGWIRGVPSDATQAEVRQITDVLRDSYDGQVQPIYNRYIDRFARAYHMSPEEAAHQLAFPYNPSAGNGTGPRSNSSAGGKVPQVGENFGGGRVLKVTKVQKETKPK